MKRMLSLAALCLTATLALAAEMPPSGPAHGPNMERLTLLLDLDAGQQVSVEKILSEQRAAMQAQRKQFKESGERPSREARKAQFASQRAATVEKLRAVLSDVQLKKFEALTNFPPGPRRGMGNHSDDKDSSK